MEQDNGMKWCSAIIIILLIVGVVNAKADVLFDLPNDLPTIEALIDLHKCIKKDEDAALARVVTSFGEQSLVTKGAVKFHNLRTILDTKLNNAYSYMVLASALASTSISLTKLTTEYSNFTKTTFRTVQKKPFVAWYYADANVAIAREIKHLRKLYMSMAASGLNLMKASMDEKLDLIFTLKGSIDRVLSIINKANLYCFLVTDCGWKPDYIWEIKNSTIRDEIANKLSGKWKNTNS